MCMMEKGDYMHSENASVGKMHERPLYRNWAFDIIHKKRKK